MILKKNDTNMRFCSPLRYPGGKAFLASEFERIVGAIGLINPVYVEPYAGGAGAALSLLFFGKVERIVINDLDKSIYAFWKSVTEQSERFARKIYGNSVTVAEWEKQKQIYSDKNADTFEKGFATFFLNRTNRSGVMNAGPIGGKEQTGSYKIDARYNKKDLAARIRKIGRYKNRIEVFNEEGIKLTKRYLDQKNTFIYLDPYFNKGAMLYLNHYGEGDHKKLANLLNNNANRHWILTYDWLKRIINLYPDRIRKQLALKYRVHDSSKVRNAHELMIFSNTTAV